MMFISRIACRICESAAFILLFLSLFLPISLAQAMEINGAVVHEADKAEQRHNDGKTVMILGVSWHSGFCETRPGLPECRNQASERTEARQFSLHGLWQIRKSYCGVPETLKAEDKKHKWLDMPELALDDGLKVELARAMPGMQSGLDRHEWIKHGTCSGDVAAGYYARALKLLAALNGSEVQTLFEGNLGKALKQDEIQQAFDSAFGPGTGERIRMRCAKDGDRQVITGLTIGLGAVDDAEQQDLGVMIEAAGTTKFGCPSGVVDEAGLQ
jgi:ribonuclease T2